MRSLSFLSFCASQRVFSPPTAEDAASDGADEENSAPKGRESARVDYGASGVILFPPGASISPLPCAGLSQFACTSAQTAHARLWTGAALSHDASLALVAAHVTPLAVAELHAPLRRAGAATVLVVDPHAKTSQLRWWLGKVIHGAAIKKALTHARYHKLVHRKQPANETPAAAVTRCAQNKARRLARHNVLANLLAILSFGTCALAWFMLRFLYN